MGKKILFLLAILFLIIVVVIIKTFSGLPDTDTIANYFPESTVISFVNFDWSEDPIVPVRKFVPLEEISDDLKKAVIISEDDTFFKHSGINMAELKHSFEENLKKKRFARGGSTITMQLARNAFLTKNKNIIRKLKEIILTKRIESLWSKEKILEYYLNIVEWGPNIYGAEAAAQYYFGKHASEINLVEGTLLAGILPNPIFYNPYKNMAGARKKQKRVLHLMRIAGLISREQAERILGTKIVLRGQRESGRKTMLTESVLDSILRAPRIPDSIHVEYDTTGIIFLPEGSNE